MKYRQFPRLLIVAVLGAGLGCDSPGDCPGACGTAVIVTTGRTDAIVPVLTRTGNGRAIGDQLFLKLADLGPELQTVGDEGFTPRLAESWSFEDPLTLTFALHPDAQWQDGQPVTANDVVFTFDVYRDTLVNSASGSDLDGIKSVRARDDRTVEFQFHRQYAEQFYDASYHMRVLPAHLLDTIPRGQFRDHPFMRAPVGSGPYRFARWAPGEQIELTADSTHWLGEAGIARLIWLVVPDLSSAMSQVAAGDADVLEYLGPPNNVARAKGSPALQVHEYPAGFYAYIAFNFRDPADPSRPHPLFADPDIRRAVTMAVDRATVATAVFGEYGRVPPGPTSPMLWVWNEQIPQTPFDTSAARTVLAQKGWGDADGDGMLERNGEPLSFDLILPSSSAQRRDAGIIVQEQLRRIGVDVQLVEMEFLTWAETSDKGQFDATFGIWGQSPSPGGIAETWGSGRSLNQGKYENSHFDALVEAARYAPTMDSARVLWDAALTQINADVPAIWLISPIQTAAASARFENVSFRPDQWATNLWKWRVREGELIARDLVPASSN